MTIYVQSTNATSTITLANDGDTLDLLPGVSAAVNIGDAISALQGGVILDIAGSVFGAADDGFDDSSPVGGDVVNVEQQGLISATNYAISSLGGNNWITNEGTIQSTESYAIIEGADNTITNSGSIIGFYYAIDDAGGDSITNTGLINSHFHQDSVISEGAGGNTISNSGTISSTHAPNAINIVGGANTIDNSGTIEGAATALQMTDGDDTIINRGLISSTNTALDVGGTLGGVKIVNFGAIDGLISIAGPASSLVNSGSIDGGISFSSGGADFVNKGEVIGDIKFAGGGDRYDGAVGSVVGQIDILSAQGTFIGGGDADTFVFNAAGLTANDFVQGGSGTANDTLQFVTAGTISTNALSHVSGFETITLANGANSIALTAALVGSADSATLTVDGGTGKDSIDASLVTKTTDNLIIDGGAGADTITAGAARDTFVYTAARDSTGANYDTISGCNFAHDLFDIPGSAATIKKINTEVTTGALSTATFNANLAAAIGASKLGADDAVLFTASSGNLKHQTFLVVDLNGTAGYQANADLVIHLTGAAGTLTAANFV